MSSSQQFKRYISILKDSRNILKSKSNLADSGTECTRITLEGLQQMSSKDENRLLVHTMLRKHLTIT